MKICTRLSLLLACILWLSACIDTSINVAVTAQPDVTTDGRPVEDTGQPDSAADVLTPDLVPDAFLPDVDTDAFTPDTETDTFIPDVHDAEDLTQPEVTEDTSTCPDGLVVGWDQACAGFGVCAAGAPLVCLDGKPECGFELLVGFEQGAEVTCDGLDNDCDGQTDEGIVDLDASDCLKQGVCADGTVATCVSNAWECDYDGVAAFEPLETLCDGKDNDCDGQTDTDVSDPWQSTCKLEGVCASGDHVACASAFEWSCDYDSLPGWEPEETLCDGADNDCDGQVDESVCAVCKPGTLDCDGTWAVECNDEGTAFVQVLDCAKDDPARTCLGAGTCVPGGEFAVNDVTDGHQFDSSAAILADGRILVLWSSENADQQDYGISAKILNSDGSTAKDEFVLNTYKAQTQRHPMAAALDDGGFLATWETAESIAGKAVKVQWQRYDTDGAPVGDYMETLQPSRNPWVAPASGNQVLLALQQPSDPDLDRWQVYAAVLNQDGSLAVNLFPVVGFPETNHVGSNQVQELDPPRFIVAWDSFLGPADGADLGAFHRIFSKDGTPLSEPLMSTDATAEHQACQQLAVSAPDRFHLAVQSSSGNVFLNLGHENFKLTHKRFSLTQDDPWTEQSSAEQLLAAGGNFLDYPPDCATAYATTGTVKPDYIFCKKATAPLKEGAVAYAFNHRTVGFGDQCTLQPDETVGYVGLFDEVVSLGSLSDQCCYSRGINLTSLGDGRVLAVWTCCNTDIHARFIEVTCPPEMRACRDVKDALQCADNGGGFETVESCSPGAVCLGAGVCVLEQDQAVSADTDHDKVGPVVTALPDGNTVIAWQDAGLDGNGIGIAFSLLSPDGAFVVQDKIPYETPDKSQTVPSVAPVGSDHFVVSWVASASGLATATARVFNAVDGSVATPEFPFESSETDQESVFVTAAPGVGFAALWTGSLPSGNQAVRAALFDQQGQAQTAVKTVADEIPVPYLEPVLTRLSGGAFVAAWTLAGQVSYQMLSAGLSPSGAALQANTTANANLSRPSLAPTADGFVLAWHSDGQPTGDATETVFRLFDGEGAPRSPEIVPNSTIPGAQQLPAVASLPDGRVVVVWQSQDQDLPGGEAIVMRWFDATGAALHNETVVNTHQPGKQFAPALSPFPDGRLAVTWVSQDVAVADGTKLIKTRIVDTPCHPFDIICGWGKTLQCNMAGTGFAPLGTCLAGKGCFAGACLP